MSGYDYYRFQEFYDRILSKWKGKIQTLEKCCEDSRRLLNTNTQAKLLSQLENLKSYFYSAKYYATTQEENKIKVLKEIIAEMKKLEFEIKSELKKK